MNSENTSMDEILPQRTLEDIYISGVPETSANFPEDLELAGSNVEYIRTLLQKGLASGKEVEGHIDRKNNGFKYSSLNAGGPQSILPLGSYARAYFGSPALIYAHSHPEVVPAFPSQDDIKVFSSLPKSAEVFAITSKQNTLLICQTEETNGIPLSAVVRGLVRYSDGIKKAQEAVHEVANESMGNLTAKQIQELFNQNKEEVTRIYGQKIAEYLISKGYVLYEFEGNIIEEPSPVFKKI